MRAIHIQSLWHDGSSRICILSLLLLVGSSLSCADAMPPEKANPQKKDSQLVVAQELVRLLIDKLDTEVLANTLSVSRQSLGVRFILVGRKAQGTAHISLAMQCTNTDSISGPTCRSTLRGTSDDSSLDSCFKTGCTSDEQTFSEAYWQNLLEDDTPAKSIEYQADALSIPGTVTCAPPPSTRWYFKFGADDAELQVSADIDEHAVWKGTDGSSLDFSYSGQARGTRTADSSAHTSVSLVLPSLMPSGPVTIAVENSNDHSRSGTISAGDEVLGQITQDGVVWGAQ
jgi:hypothetical protein